LTALSFAELSALDNLSLPHVKRKYPHTEGLIVFPIFIPLPGFIVSAAYVLSEIIGLVGV